MLIDQFSGDAPDVLRRVSHCVTVLRTLFSVISEKKSGFSVARALLEIVCDIESAAVFSPAFYAEIITLFAGVQGALTDTAIISDDHGDNELEGREAAILRSNQLDAMVKRVYGFMDRYSFGLDRSYPGTL